MCSLLAVSVAGRALATGQEAVSMPFACSIEQGRVRLEPSRQQSYRLAGQREQRFARVCSSRRPDRCRTVAIHRFAFDCGGARVTWFDAASEGPASRGYPWRISTVAGRMVLTTSPHERDPIRQLALPPGFAPAPATGLTFADGGSTTPLAAASGVMATAEPRPEPRAPGSEPGHPATRLSSVVTEVTKDAKDASPSTALRLPPESPLIEPTLTAAVPMGHGWTATVVHADDRTTGAWMRLLRSAGGEPSVLTWLGIVALLLSATAVAARQRIMTRLSLWQVAGPMKRPLTDASGATAWPEVKDKSPTSEEASVGPAAARVTGQPASSNGTDDARPSPPPPLMPPRSRGKPISATVDAGAIAETDPAWLAVVEMRTTAEALLDLVRQMVVDHVPDNALREVLVADLSAISNRLDGPDLAKALSEGRLDLVHPIYAQAIVDLERAQALARIEHQRSLEPQVPTLPSPATLEEACAYLGVNPRASESAAKKVVDALRQSWHPDLARDEADRLAREARIKEINAAWDLIRSR